MIDTPAGLSEILRSYAPLYAGTFEARVLPPGLFAFLNPILDY